MKADGGAGKLGGSENSKERRRLLLIQTDSDKGYSSLGDSKTPTLANRSVPDLRRREEETSHQ